jgi:hypothetical protein
MVQRRDDLSLSLESGDPGGIRGERIWQDFDGYFALQARIAGAIDLAIPPAPRADITSYGPNRTPGPTGITVGDGL